MSTLRAPTHNPTPHEVRQMSIRDGITRLALAFDTTRSACRWFTVAELNTANHPADVLAATKTAPKRYQATVPHTVKAVDTGVRYGCQPPNWYLEWEFQQWDNAIAASDIEDTRNAQHHIDRWMYFDDLERQIKEALKSMPPVSKAQNSYQYAWERTPYALIVYVPPPVVALDLEPSPQLTGDYWQLSVTRDDPQAVAMYQRHYSFKERGRKPPTKFGNPGHYIALMTVNRDALFLWSKEKLRRDGQTGVNCAVFRNEGKTLSSVLIQEAVEIAQRRWPGERLFTFIDGSKIKSANPGYCFKLAGWKQCGTTQKGLLIFEWVRPVTITVNLPQHLLKNMDTKLSLGTKIVPVTVSVWHEALKVA